MRRLLVIASSAALACPGALENPERFRGDYCLSSTERLLQNSCAVSGCHDAEDQEAGLDLSGTSEQIATRLSERANWYANEDTADADLECQAFGEGGETPTRIMDPLNPAQSLLYLKSTPSPPCGDRMPQVGSPLSGEQLDCLLEWIAAQ